MMLASVVHIEPRTCGHACETVLQVSNTEQLNQNSYLLSACKTVFETKPQVEYTAQGL